MSSGKSIYLSIILATLTFFVACKASENDNTEALSTSTKNYVEEAAFTSLQGDSVRIADFNGKVIMIDFWETWCKPCIASFPTMEKLQKEYADEFVFLAVTPGFTDSPEDARNFANEHDYSFRYLIDTEGLHKKLEVQSIPYKVFVDPGGNFIKSTTGSYGADQDYKKVKKIIEKHKAGKK